MAPSVVSMSTLYVLSLRTEEDLVETDGYVPGGLAAGAIARLGGALVGSPGSEEPWRLSPLKGVPPQALSPPGVCGGGWEGPSRRGAAASQSYRSRCFSLAYSVLLQVAGPLSGRGHLRGPG